MDAYDFKEEKPRRRFRLLDALWNLATLVLVLAAIAAAVYFVYIFFNPFSPLNPLPPVVAGQSLADQATVTQLAEPPTSQPVEATATQSPTETPTLVPDTPTPSATPLPGSYFDIQEGSPVALDSSIFHPELGCAFSGVAGQAFGLDDAPIAGLRVQITGEYNGQAIDKTGLTGAATQYGPGSYFEIVLSNQPIDSTSQLQIVLLDANGTAVSDSVAFDTHAACTQNLILINFRAQP